MIYRSNSGSMANQQIDTFHGEKREEKPLYLSVTLVF
jgi:hypothetical protein